MEFAGDDKRFRNRHVQSRKSGLVLGCQGDQGRISGLAGASARVRPVGRRLVIRQENVVGSEVGEHAGEGSPGLGRRNPTPSSLNGDSDKAQLRSRWRAKSRGSPAE